MIRDSTLKLVTIIFQVRDWDDDDWILTDRVATWKEKTYTPIRGLMATTYPQAHGWRLEGASSKNLAPHHLSISLITNALQKRETQHPNCERIWNELFGTILPWHLIWESLGTLFTNPKDEERFFKLLHRKLNTRTSDSRSKSDRCRLKCGCKETQVHLMTQCIKLKFYRKFVTKFLRVLGTKRSEIHPTYTWLFNLNNSIKPLNMPSRALLRISLRVLYKHLTALEMDGTPIDKTKICTSIAYSFMSRLLSYQLYRRNFYYDKVNSSTPVHRSSKEVSLVAPVGKLDYHTGTLRIKPKLRKLLKKYKVWVNFNRSHSNP